MKVVPADLALESLVDFCEEAVIDSINSFYDFCEENFKRIYQSHKSQFSDPFPYFLCKASFIEKLPAEKNCLVLFFNEEVHILGVVIFFSECSENQIKDYIQKILIVAGTAVDFHLLVDPRFCNLIVKDHSVILEH